MQNCLKFETNSPSDELRLGNFSIAIDITVSHDFGGSLFEVSISFAIR